MQQLAVELEHVCKQTSAQRDRVSDDRLKHRLHIRRRGTDCAKNFRGRCLLLERLGEIAVARLHFLEQPRVLDGDHRLVGEGGEEIDLFVAERSPLLTADDERADCLVLAHQRHGKNGPVAETRRHGVTGGKFVRCVQQVVHVDRLAVDESPPGHPVSSDRPLGEVDRYRTMMGAQR